MLHDFKDLAIRDDVASAFIAGMFVLKSLSLHLRNLTTLRPAHCEES